MPVNLHLFRHPKSGHLLLIFQQQKQQRQRRRRPWGAARLGCPNRPGWLTGLPDYLPTRTATLRSRTKNSPRSTASFKGAVAAGVGLQTGGTDVRSGPEKSRQTHLEIGNIAPARLYTAFFVSSSVIAACIIILHSVPLIP